MAKYASIKVRPRDENSPNIGTVLHNQRYVKVNDLLPEKYRLPNYHLIPVTNVTKTVNDWVAENEKRYQSTHNRKLRSDANRLESLAIILSGEQVEKCSPDEIWRNAIAFKTWFEERYKTKVRTMDWHRDEGSISEIGKVIRNDHIHLEFDNVNTDGKMVRRLFSKGDLINFQDKIAEIYKPLGFIRGEDTVKKHRHDTPKRGLGQRKWKAKKQKETTAKALTKKKELEEDLNSMIEANTPDEDGFLPNLSPSPQTYEMMLEYAEESAKAEKKELEAEIKNLKDELKGTGAKRADYARIEQLNRDLMEQIKSKDLTIASMKEEIRANSLTIINLKNELISTQKELKNVEPRIKEMSQELEKYKSKYENWVDDNEDLKAENEDLDIDYRKLERDYESLKNTKDEQIDEHLGTIRELKIDIRELKEIVAKKDPKALIHEQDNNSPKL